MHLHNRVWTTVIALIAFFVLPLLGQTSKKTLALVGGKLLDGYDVPPIHHAAVIIEGNRIVSIGPAAQVKIPTGATVIDTSGRTMMPGLIEAHAHLNILGHGSSRNRSGSAGYIVGTCNEVSVVLKGHIEDRGRQRI